MLGKLAAGDVVMVTRIDRLARSTFDLSRQQKEAIRRRAQGATLDELARSYNISRATISRLSLRGAWG